MGKRDSGSFKEPLGAGMVNSPCCRRDPEWSLEQGPEGPETPIQVVLRWVQIG